MNRFKMKIAIFAFFVLLYNVFNHSYAFGTFNKPACGKTGLSFGKNGISPDNGGTISTDGKAIQGCEQNAGTSSTQETGTQCGDNTSLPKGNQCGGNISPCDDKGKKCQECDGENYKAGGVFGELLKKFLKL